MPWKGPGKRYYYQSQRAGKRIRYTYYGAGEVAELAARLDQIDQERRLLERMDRRQRLALFKAETATPVGLETYSAAVRGIVADVLGRLGFHQHKRQWRRMKQLEAQSVARQMRDLYFKEKPTNADLTAYRQLLNEHTALARQFGDLSMSAEGLLLMVLHNHAQMRIGAGMRAAQLRSELGYDESTALERLLIDEIVLCWIDYYRIEIAYAQQTKDTFTVVSLEQWERVLSSKQLRYERAIVALARVRRLLHLPGPQVNINMPGGQQVNVAGEVRT